MPGLPQWTTGLSVVHDFPSPSYVRVDRELSSSMLHPAEPYVRVVNPLDREEKDSCSTFSWGCRVLSYLCKIYGKLERQVMSKLYAVHLVNKGSLVRTCVFDE